MDIKWTYKPHKHQKRLHGDTHRYIVCCAGRRFGKSVFARQHILLNALYNPGLYWIVAPTYRQGKMIHWRELLKEVPLGLRTYKNEQEQSIHLANGSIVEVKGADNEDSLRGVGLKGVVLDEAAFQKPHVWEEILRPMLLDSGGWAIFIGTPAGKNWFWELFNRGQKKSDEYDPEWSSYQFSSYENPFIEKKEIDKAKRRTDEDTFAQEYMAQFRKFKGLIYKNFEKKIHVVDSFAIPDDWPMYRSVDFGYGVNPTVCNWITISPVSNKWYLIDEYSEVKDTADYHCGMILSKSGAYPPVILSYADPSNPKELERWAKNGVYLTRAVRPPGTTLGNWVQTGIDIVQEKLKVSVMDQKPQLFIFKNCKDTINEFESYRWKVEKDPQLNQPGRPEKANDHHMDAIRYFAVSYRQHQKYIEPESKKDWSFR
jgi:hypothetical protein